MAILEFAVNTCVSGIGCRIASGATFFTVKGLQVEKIQYRVGVSGCKAYVA